MLSNASKSRKAPFAAVVAVMGFAIVGTVGAPALAVPFGAAPDSVNAAEEVQESVPSCHDAEASREAPVAAVAPEAAKPSAVVSSQIATVPDPYADRFKGIVLKTHEGKNVRFYEDLLQGKIVLINFMYANCKGR